MILSAYDGTSDRAFGAVVVERHERIFNEAREPIPVGDGVGGCFADRKRLEHGMTPQPDLELRENFGGLSTSAVCRAQG